MIWSIALASSLDGAAESVASGDFAAAGDAYTEAIASGAVSADLFYNLGNVRYRQDRVAEAILAWRRAAVLAPRDPDVAANLEFARRRVVDDLVAADPCPPWAPWQSA
ncbi:MAG: tetratricopeptide repeat protein, partial [Deltaproteobacteria bacterium]|nr:tetratricopeptide repeat protein [Deltaproteobacteria bacterium]